MIMLITAVVLIAMHITMFIIIRQCIADCEREQYTLQTIPSTLVVIYGCIGLVTSVIFMIDSAIVVHMMSQLGLLG